MSTGNTLTGVCNGRPIRRHPDTDNQFAGLVIPAWDNLLHLAASCYEMTGLGFFGIDIVLDEEHGPMLLELNARPGLSIQVANSSGLLPRLRKIEEMELERFDAKDRVQFVKHQFSNTFFMGETSPSYFL